MLVAGVVHLDDGVMVPSSCSLSVSMVEWLSGVVAPLAWGVGWLLMDSMRDLRNRIKPCRRDRAFPPRHLNKSSCFSFLPGARVVAQLEHVRVVLGQNGDGVTLLPDDQPRLLLVGVAKVDSVELKTRSGFQTEK